MAETARTLNCPMCGAPTRSDATNCEHCGARLATVACPSCFGMIFAGSRFCPLCGARADREVGENTVFGCPRCDNSILRRLILGKAMLNECQHCEGLWVDKFSFETICSDREQQSAVLGPAIRVPLPEFKREKIRYLKCPECAELMQRVNFAGCSGVVIDVCREHGSWFDNKELQSIIEFIRTGGLDEARRRELANVEEARRRLAAERTAAAWSENNRVDPPSNAPVVDAIFAVGEILGSIFRK